MKMLRILATAIVLFGLNSCGSRSMTRPYSDVVKDAASKGLMMPSAEEERAVFFKVDETNKERVMNLIKVRSEKSFRDENYRLGPIDEIEINVFDVPEMNVTARIKESGFVALPLVGAVKAAGLTEVEFGEELKKRLATYIKHPELTVFVSHYGSQKVAVIGAVSKPGNYSLKKGTNSILELLSQAGGVTDTAGNLVSFVPAEYSGISAATDVEARARLSLASAVAHDNREGSIELYLDHVMGTSGGIPLEIPVRGGDMIIIPEAGQVTVEGEVEKRGAYDLKRRTTLLGALAAAGGISYGAKVDEVEIIRDVPGDKKGRLIVDLEKIATGEQGDVRLRNGDLVRVPSDSGRRMSQDTFEGFQKIINFGIGGTVSLVP